jgi:hypothetical protein
MKGNPLVPQQLADKDTTTLEPHILPRLLSQRGLVRLRGLAIEGLSAAMSAAKIFEACQQGNLDELQLELETFEGNIDETDVSLVLSSPWPFRTPSLGVLTVHPIPATAPPLPNHVPICGHRKCGYPCPTLPTPTEHAVSPSRAEFGPALSAR